MDDVPDCVVGDLQLDVLMLYRRLPVQRLLRLAVARGRRAGVGRQGRVGGPPPRGPVPVLVGLMDGNGCSIGHTFCPIGLTSRHLLGNTWMLQSVLF